MTYEEAKRQAMQWLAEADAVVVTTREIRRSYENVDTYVFVERVPEFDPTEMDPTRPYYIPSPAVLIVDKKSGTIIYDTFPNAFEYTKGKLIEDNGNNSGEEDKEQ